MHSTRQRNPLISKFSVQSASLYFNINIWWSWTSIHCDFLPWLSGFNLHRLVLFLCACSLADLKLPFSHLLIYPFFRLSLAISYCTHPHPPTHIHTSYCLISPTYTTSNLSLTLKHIIISSSFLHHLQHFSVTNTPPPFSSPIHTASSFMQPNFASFPTPISPHIWTLENKSLLRCALGLSWPLCVWGKRGGGVRLSVRVWF